MNFFDILRSILFNKPKIDVDTSCEEFSPFMVNRWMSFYDQNRAIFVNETLNKYTGIFSDICDTYKLYVHIVPVLRFKKINYIKKKKEEKDKRDQNLQKQQEIVARNMNISTREIEQYIDFIKLNHI